LQDPRIDSLDEAVACAAAAVAQDAAIDAAVPTLLLRGYLATGRADLAETLGLALAQALAVAGADPTVLGRAAWLTLLVEASIVADDDRLPPAAAALSAALQASSPALTRIDERSASVEARLRASAILSGDDLVQRAIDDLEHAVGAAYRPGDGLVLDRNGAGVRCSVDDHVRAASALLTAFELTGRLPYSMLAEELIAVARREPQDQGIAIACRIARVLCRLADLHDDAGYRGAAVIAAGADYRADAAHMLAAESARARTAEPSLRAAYGIALGELLRDVR
jgi:hypothetical protein